MARGVSPNPLPRIERALEESTGGEVAAKDNADLLRFSWQLKQEDVPYIGACEWVERQDQCIVSIRSLKAGLRYPWSTEATLTFLREINTLTRKVRQYNAAFIYEANEVRYRISVTNNMGRRTARKIIEEIERAVHDFDAHVRLFEFFIRYPMPPSADDIKGSLNATSIMVH